MRYSLTYLMFFSLLVMSSCYQDQDNTDTIVITQLPTPETETDLFGSLVSQNGGTQEDYILNINDEEHKVDGDYFYLKGLSVSKQGQLIEAYSGLDLIGLGMPNLLEYDINKVELVSVENLKIDMSGIDALTASFTSTESGGEIVMTVPSSSLTTTENLEASVDRVLKDKVAQAYGNAAYKYSPNSEEVSYLFLQPVAGFHLAVTNNTNTQILKDQSPFELKFDNEMIGKGLFHYNSEFGYWIYAADITPVAIQLTSMGHYMVADSEPGIYIEGHLENDSKPLSYVKTQFEQVTNSHFTTEKGRWGAVLPPASSFEQKIVTSCGEIISVIDQSVSQTGEIAVSKVDLNNENLFSVQARIFDCEGNSSDGTALQLSDSSQSELYFFSNSDLDLNLLVCDEAFEVSSIDTETQMQGPIIPWSTTNEDQLDYLPACEELKNGFTYIKVRDDETLLEPFRVETIGEITTLSSQNNDIRINFNGDEVKAYSVEDVSIFMERADFGSDGYFINCTSELGCGLRDFRVTHFDTTMDGWFRVSFTGELWMQTIEDPVAGYFQVEGLILTRI